MRTPYLWKSACLLALVSAPVTDAYPNSFPASAWASVPSYATALTTDFGTSDSIVYFPSSYPTISLILILPSSYLSSAGTLTLAWNKILDFSWETTTGWKPGLAYCSLLPFSFSGLSFFLLRSSALSFLSGFLAPTLTLLESGSYSIRVPVWEKGVGSRFPSRVYLIQFEIPYPTYLFSFLNEWLVFLFRKLSLTMLQFSIKSIGFLSFHKWFLSRILAVFQWATQIPHTFVL